MMDRNDLLERISLLGRVVNCVGRSIEGRKKAQKLIFVLQRLGVIEEVYKFSWAFYGVYSSEVTLDFEQGENFGLFIEDTDYAGQYPTYTIKIKNEAGWNLESLPPDVEEKIKKINSMDTPLLEVVSSIIYFKDKGYSDDEVRRLLDAHKGHLKDRFNEGFKIFRQWKDNLI